MLSGLVKKLVNRFLNEYVEGEFDVGISLFGKHALDLEHLEVKSSTLNDMIFREGIPLRLERVYVGHVLVDIPFSHLGSRPVKVSIKNVLVVANMHLEAAWNETTARDDLKAAVKAAIVALLETMHPESEVTRLSENPGLYFSSEGMLNRTITRIVDNLEVSLENISVRVETPCIHDQDLSLNASDAVSEGLYHGGLVQHWDLRLQDVSALDLTIANAQVFTTDENWDRHFDDDCDYIVFKVLRMVALEATFAHRDRAMRRVSDEARPAGAKELSVKAYYEHYLRHRARSGGVRPMLSPLNLEMRVKLNTAFSVGAGEPHRADAQIKLTPIVLAIGEDELVFLMQILSHLSRHGQWLERIEARERRKSEAWVAERRKTHPSEPEEEYHALCNRRARILTRITDAAERKQRFEALLKDQDLVDLEAHLPLDVLKHAIEMAGRDAQETRNFKLQPFHSQDSTLSEGEPVQAMQAMQHSPRSRASKTQEAVVSGTGWQKELATTLESEFAGAETSYGRLAKPGLDPDEIEITFSEGSLGLVLDHNFQNDSVVVASCIAGSPAARTRLIEPGMVITAIGNYDVTDLSVEETLAKLRRGRRPLRVRFKGSVNAARVAANYVRGSVVNFVRAIVALDALDVTLFAGPGEQSLCVTRLIGVGCSLDAKSAGAAVGPLERLAHIVDLDLGLGILHADVISALPSSVSSEVWAPIHLMSSACEFDQDGMREHHALDSAIPPAYEHDIDWNPFGRTHETSVASLLEDPRWVFSCFATATLLWNRRRLRLEGSGEREEAENEALPRDFISLYEELGDFEKWTAQSTRTWQELVRSGERLASMASAQATAAHWSAVATEDLPPLLEYNLRFQRLANALALCRERPFLNVELSLVLPDRSLEVTSLREDDNGDDVDDGDNVENFDGASDMDSTQKRRSPAAKSEVPITMVTFRGSISDIEVCMQDAVLAKLGEFSSSLSARIAPFQGHEVPIETQPPPDFGDLSSLSWVRYEVAVQIGILRAILPDAAMVESKSLLRAMVVVGPIGIYPRNELPEEAATALDYLRPHKKVLDSIFLRVDRIRAVVVCRGNALASATDGEHSTSAPIDLQDQDATMLLQYKTPMSMKDALQRPSLLPRPIAERDSESEVEGDVRFFDAQQSVRSDLGGRINEGSASASSDADEDTQFQDAFSQADDDDDDDDDKNDDGASDTLRRQVSWARRRSSSSVGAVTGGEGADPIDEAAEQTMDGPSSVSLLEMYLNILRVSFRGAPYGMQPVEVGLVLGDLNLLVTESHVKLLLDLIDVLQKTMQNMDDSQDMLPKDAAWRPGDRASIESHPVGAAIDADAAAEDTLDAIIDKFGGARDVVSAMGNMQQGLTQAVEHALGVESEVYGVHDFVLRPQEATGVFERMCDVLGPVLARELNSKVAPPWVAAVGPKEAVSRIVAFFYGDLWVQSERLKGTFGSPEASGGARTSVRSPTAKGKRTSAGDRRSRSGPRTRSWVTLRLDLHVTNIRADLFTTFQLSFSSIDVHCATSTSNSLARVGVHVGTVTMVNFRSRDGENPMVIQPTVEETDAARSERMYCLSFHIVLISDSLQQALRQSDAENGLLADADASDSDTETSSSEEDSEDEMQTEGLGDASDEGGEGYLRGRRTSSDSTHEGVGAMSTSGSSDDDGGEDDDKSLRALRKRLEEASDGPAAVEKAIARIHRQTFKSPKKEVESLQGALDMAQRARARVRRQEEQVIRSREASGTRFRSTLAQRGCGALLWEAQTSRKSLSDTGRSLGRVLRQRQRPTTTLERETSIPAVSVTLVVRDLVVEISERLALTGLELLDTIQKAVAGSSPSEASVQSGQSGSMHQTEEERPGDPTVLSGVEFSTEMQGVIIRVKTSRDRPFGPAPGGKDDGQKRIKSADSRRGSHVGSVTEGSSLMGDLTTLDVPSAMSGAELARQSFNDIFVDIGLNVALVYVAHQCVEECELKMSRTTISITYDRTTTLLRRRQQRRWSRQAVSPSVTVTHAVLKPWDASLEYVLRRDMNKPREITRLVSGSMGNLQLSLWTTDVSVLTQAGSELGEIAESVARAAEKVTGGGDGPEGEKEGENGCSQAEQQNQIEAMNTDGGAMRVTIFKAQGVSILAMAMDKGLVIADDPSYGRHLEACAQAAWFMERNAELFASVPVVVRWLDSLVVAVARNGAHFSTEKLALLQGVDTSRDTAEQSPLGYGINGQPSSPARGMGQLYEGNSVLSPLIEDDKDIMASDTDDSENPSGPHYVGDSNLLEVSDRHAEHRAAIEARQTELFTREVMDILHDRIKLSVSGMGVELVQEVLRSETRVETFLPVLRFGAEKIELRGESFSQFSKDFVLATYVDMEAKFYNRRIGSWEFIMEPWTRTKASVLVSEADQNISVNLEALNRLNINVSEDLLALLLKLQSDLERASSSLSEDPVTRAVMDERNEATTANDGKSVALSKGPSVTVSKQVSTVQRTLRSRRRRRIHRQRSRKGGRKSKKTVARREAQHWLINNTGIELVMHDLYQVGYDYRGIITVSYRDGWYLPTHERWNVRPLMRITLLPYRRRGTVGSLGNDGGDARAIPIGSAERHLEDDDFDDSASSALDSDTSDSRSDASHVVRPYQDGNKYVLPYEGSRSAEVPHLLVEVKDATGAYYQTSVDLVPYILFPNQGSAEWFRLRSDGAKLDTPRGAELMLSIEFDLHEDLNADPKSALREVHGDRQAVIEPFRMASGAMVPMNFQALPKKHWYKNINRYEINKSISTKQYTKLRAVAVDFSRGLDFASPHKPLLMVLPVDEAGETMLTTRAVSDARVPGQREAIGVAKPPYEGLDRGGPVEEREASATSIVSLGNDIGLGGKDGLSLFGKKSRKETNGSDDHMPADASFSFNVFAVSAMRDQKRRVIFLESPFKLMNAVDHTLEVLICEKGTIAEQENRKDVYPSLEPMSLEHAECKSSGRHLARYGMDVNCLFDRRSSTKWVDGGHRLSEQSDEVAEDAEMLQAVNEEEGAGFALDSYVEWTFAQPVQICLYRLTPALDAVVRDAHATPFDSDKQVDASRLGLDPVQWRVYGKLLQQESSASDSIPDDNEDAGRNKEKAASASAAANAATGRAVTGQAGDLEPVETPWVLLDERSGIAFDRERRPREYFLPQVGSFHCYRIELSSGCTFSAMERQGAAKARPYEEEIDLARASCGPKDSVPIALSCIELFQERLLARRTRVLVASGLVSPGDESNMLDFDDEEALEESRHRSSAEWTCPTCEISNVGGDATCKLCGTTRPEVRDVVQTDVFAQDIEDPDMVTSDQAEQARKRRSRAIEDMARRSAQRHMSTTAGSRTSSKTSGNDAALEDDNAFAKAIELDKMSGKVAVASDAGSVRGGARFRTRRVHLTLESLSVEKPRNTKELGRNLLYRQIGRRVANQSEQDDARSNSSDVDSLDSDTPGFVAGSSSPLRRRSTSLDYETLELNMAAETVVQVVKSQRLTMRLITPQRGSKAGINRPHSTRGGLSLDGGVLLRFDHRETFRRWFDAIESILKRLRRRHQGKVIEAEEFTGMRRLVRPGEEFSIPLNFIYSTRKWSLFIRPDTNVGQVQVHWAQVLDHISAQILRFEDSVDNVIPDLACEPFKYSERVLRESKLEMTPFSFSAAFTKRFLKGHHSGLDDSPSTEGTSKLIPRVEITIRAWVRVINALPYSVEVRFKSTEEAGQHTIAPGQEINMCKIRRDEEAQFRIPALDTEWTDRQRLESLSYFQDSARKTFGHSSQRQQQLNSGTPVQFWKRGGNRQYLKNVAAEAKIDRSRDPTGPLYVVLYAPFWFYNYSDLNLLAIPRDSFLSPGDESKDVFLEPNFLPDNSEQTKGVHVLPHLRNMDGKAKVSIAVALSQTELQGVGKQGPSAAQNTNAWKPEMEAGGETARRVQAVRNNWLTDFENEHQDYFVSNWSRPVKVQSTSENIQWRSFRFVLNAITILRREIGIEIVTGGVNAFTRSVQVIFRSKYLLVNRVPDTILHFTQSVPRVESQGAFAQGLQDYNVKQIQRTKMSQFLRRQKSTSNGGEPANGRDLEGDGRNYMPAPEGGDDLAREEEGSDDVDEETKDGARRHEESLDDEKDDVAGEATEDNASSKEEEEEEEEENEDEDEVTTALRVHGVHAGKTIKDLYLGPNPSHCQPFHFGGFQKEFVGYESGFRIGIVDGKLEDMTHESAVISAAKESEYSLLLRSKSGSSRERLGAHRVRVAIRKERGTTFIIFSRDLSMSSHPRPFYVIRNRTPFPLEVWQDRMARVHFNTIVYPGEDFAHAWDNPNLSQDIRARILWPLFREDQLTDVNLGDLAFESSDELARKVQDLKEATSKHGHRHLTHQGGHKRRRQQEALRRQLQSTLERYESHEISAEGPATAYKGLSLEGLFPIDAVKQFDDLCVAEPRLFKTPLFVSVEGFIEESSKTLAFRLDSARAIEAATTSGSLGLATLGFFASPPGSEGTLSDDEDKVGDGEDSNDESADAGVKEDDDDEDGQDLAGGASVTVAEAKRAPRRPRGEEGQLPASRVSKRASAVSKAGAKLSPGHRKYNVFLRLVLKADAVFQTRSSAEHRGKYKVVVRVGGKSREFSGSVVALPGSPRKTTRDLEGIAEDLHFSLDTKPTQVFILVYVTNSMDKRELLRAGTIDLVKQLWAGKHAESWLEVNSPEWQKCKEDLAEMEREERRRVQALLDDGFTKSLRDRAMRLSNESEAQAANEDDSASNDQASESRKYAQSSTNLSVANSMSILEREKSLMSTLSRESRADETASQPSYRSGASSPFGTRSLPFLPMRTRQPTFTEEEEERASAEPVPLFELRDPDSESSQTARHLVPSSISNLAKRKGGVNQEESDEAESGASTSRSQAWMQIRCETVEPSQENQGREGKATQAVLELGEAATLKVRVFLSSVGLSLVHASQRLEICYSIMQRVHVFSELSPGNLQLSVRLGHLQVDNHDPNAQYDVMVVPEKRPPVNPKSRYPYPREDCLSLEMIVRQSEEPYLELETFELDLSRLVVNFEESFLGNVLSMWAKVLESTNQDGASGLDARDIEHPPASTAHFILQVQALADFMYVYWFKIGTIQMIFQCHLDGGKKIVAEDQVSMAIKQYVPTMWIQDFRLRISDFSRSNEFTSVDEFYRVMTMFFVQEAISRNLQTALTQTNFSLNPFPACKTIAIGAYEMVHQPYMQRHRGCGGVCSGCQHGLAAFIASLSAGMTDLVHAYTDFVVMGLENVANANQYDLVARPLTLTTAAFRNVTSAISVSSHKIANELLNPVDRIEQIRTPRLFTRSGEMILYGPGNRPIQQDLPTQRAAAAVFHFVYGTWRLRKSLRQEAEARGQILREFDPREYMNNRLRHERGNLFERWMASFRDTLVSLQYEFAQARNEEGDPESEENDRLLGGVGGGGGGGGGTSSGGGGTRDRLNS
ncbi:Vacuolar protein sorting-associated protein 13a [Hondaea fermentalgiana]|uniref:Vacuolar protein sorting-associated protein 13a n=1 Tax=Hondaea fermentalgiana TaxID=2315210 RepID=A0A2R5GKV4_9STRA|nr:Vacuolar protein sorting-associated protein 13a [Hondaea fermentalgiana]|eukprot:GBG29253.1 Vacuolar protein sorting-associated protein 13a [Hondaea fermentalgiana]